MRTNRSSVLRAFTLIELIVVLFILALLVAVMGPSVRKDREKSRQVYCVNNLKQVALAFRLFDPDFVMATSTNHGGTLEISHEVWRSFLAMSNELATPNILVCPSDLRRPASAWSLLANSNISYFVGLDADEFYPQLLLTGDRLLAGRGPATNKVLILSSNSPVDWAPRPHPGGGNIAFADGTVRQLSTGSLQDSITSIFGQYHLELTNSTLRLAMPE